MNEEFVTQAIQNDRCLKADRLLDRFETELRTKLERHGREMIEAQPDLFPEEPSRGIKISWDNGTIIANARDNLTMNRVNRDDPSSHLKLNVSLRWVDPIDWGHQDVDGALCAACYKINGGDREDYERVKAETSSDEWDINFAQDQFDNAPGIVYIPVETGAEYRTATETLRDHFAEFGHYWGVEPGDS